MTRLMAVAAVAAFLFAGGVASADPEAGKYYRIKNENSGKLLAVVDDSDEVGAKIIQSGPKKGDEALQWKLVQAGEYYRLINRKSGKALEVPDSSKDAGVQLQQGKDHNGKNQKWSVEKISNDHFVIKALCSGLVVDVADADKAAGAHINQFPLNEKGGRKNQKWLFVEAD